ncbi:ParB/RepB/Spo0J family partition protein [Aquicella lusitana]|uniref:ParB family chromosome partitioning protein n=1 Tax=Aquicella lusitana TaxID=254246 RepID=A0A370GIV4_9COXI|nr:ParB/RepB/Spo0J family partition protein [Aquicella lusitana]RDI43732.1 ParB family chromosome partitioning protein [Aquicella lusitana]VVC74267.1 putative chromosome-partitioning protein ParB [Aquicella lusitana]
MSKKKRFGISEALTRGLSETIHVVENNSGIFRNVVLPLSRIELDPDNPRKLAIDISDVRQGIRPDDPLYQRKQEELEKLKELAHTIKASGVINPVVVYKRGEYYRIVAGERRCLASLLASKQEIEARVFNEKPRGFELKLLQWVENTAREDLTLDERLGNVREIIREYQNQYGQTEVNASLLKNITGLSLSQTTYYLSALNAPADVQAHIQNGNIRNLDKAALIASVASPDVRKAAIEACVNGSSLKALRSMINQQKGFNKHPKVSQASKRGRSTRKINMGSTLSTDVIKTIVDSVIHHKKMDIYATRFSEIDWMDLRQVTKAFRQLIEILEVETAL